MIALIIVVVFCFNYVICFLFLLPCFIVLCYSSLPLLSMRVVLIIRHSDVDTEI